jgi:hypothetical protein
MDKEVDLLCSQVQENTVFACVAVIDHMITVIVTGTELNCEQCHQSYLWTTGGLIVHVKYFHLNGECAYAVLSQSTHHVN